MIAIGFGGSVYANSAYKGTVINTSDSRPLLKAFRFRVFVFRK